MKKTVPVLHLLIFSLLTFVMENPSLQQGLRLYMEQQPLAFIPFDDCEHFSGYHWVLL